MDQLDKNEIIFSSSTSYLDEQINDLKSMLAYALALPIEDIKISFPTIKNFYNINNLCKSSWAIYLENIEGEKLPKLLYTGNILIQGANFTKRSSRSPFGVKALSNLTSIANTFSYDASYYKQNWTLDLNLFEEDTDKLKFSVKEYQEFLMLLNTLRAKTLLHLSEEGNYDFVICEFSEPSDPLFFVDLENLDSLATKVKTYFKPISENALNTFLMLSTDTEFEGKFVNLQPGTWLRDDVLIELEKYYAQKFTSDINIQHESKNLETDFVNPFKVQSLYPSY